MICECIKCELAKLFCRHVSEINLHFEFQQFSKEKDVMKFIVLNKVWRIQDFSVNQILREINFRESSSFKTTFFVVLGALNFVNLVNFSLTKVQKFINFKHGRILVSGFANYDFT